MLTPGEIESLVRHLVDRHGLSKVRLTGGDPTARPDLIEIIERINAITGINDLAMTTNGLSLAPRAHAYARAGLRRVNVSLDTLDQEKFAAMTGVDGLERVLRGIDTAIEAGLSPVKLNTVVIRGSNESSLLDLVRYAASRDLPIRFIELMPMGPLGSQWEKRYVPEREMRAVLDDIVSDWRQRDQGSDAGRMYDTTLRDGSCARIGFITPMSCNFCANCNRMRIASDGSLYPCLMDEPSGSVLDALRPRFDAEHFDTLLRQGLSHKAPEHPSRGFVTMTIIGG